MTREEAIKLLNKPDENINYDEKWGVYFTNDWLAAYEMAISALREQPRWISVEERLPEDCVQVLACTKHGKAFSAHRENGKWRVSGSVKITHWMPLPEAPEVDV